jgi:hypothetical protein
MSGELSGLNSPLNTKERRIAQLAPQFTQTDIDYITQRKTYITENWIQDIIDL